VKRLGCIILVLSSACAGNLPASPDGPSPGASLSSIPASPEPTATLVAYSPTPFGTEDLPGIVITGDTVPSGMTIDDELSGRDALMQPTALLEHSTFAAQPGFVDARMTRVGTSGPGSYWEEGGYVTWTALYQTPLMAAGAFEVLVSEHESPAGWGMEREARIPRGDDGVWLEGPAYGFDTRLLIWRAGNLLLAAAALGVTATGEDAVDGLRSIADGMDARVGHLS
jgi:hypothetical protein